MGTKFSTFLFVTCKLVASSSLLMRPFSSGHLHGHLPTVSQLYSLTPPQRRQHALLLSTELKDDIMRTATKRMVASNATSQYHTDFVDRMIMQMKELFMLQVRSNEEESEKSDSQQVVTKPMEEKSDSRRRDKGKTFSLQTMYESSQFQQRRECQKSDRMNEDKQTSRPPLTLGTLPSGAYPVIAAHLDVPNFVAFSHTCLRIHQNSSNVETLLLQNGKNVNLSLLFDFWKNGKRQLFLPLNLFANLKGITLSNLQQISHAMHRWIVRRNRKKTVIWKDMQQICIRNDRYDSDMIADRFFTGLSWCVRHDCLVRLELESVDVGKRFLCFLMHQRTLKKMSLHFVRLWDNPEALSNLVFAALQDLELKYVTPHLTDFLIARSASTVERLCVKEMPRQQQPQKLKRQTFQSLGFACLKEVDDNRLTQLDTNYIIGENCKSFSFESLTLNKLMCKQIEFLLDAHKNLYRLHFTMHSSESLIDVLKTIQSVLSMQCDRKKKLDLGIVCGDVGMADRDTVFMWMSCLDSISSLVTESFQIRMELQTLTFPYPTPGVVVAWLTEIVGRYKEQIDVRSQKTHVVVKRIRNKRVILVEWNYSLKNTLIK